MALELIILIALVIIVNGVDFTYPITNGVGIGNFDFQASDPDNNEGPYAFLGNNSDTCKTAQTDDDLDTGCSIKSSNTAVQFTWGIGPGEQQSRGVSGTSGMVGTFYATNIALGSNPDTGNPYTNFTVIDVSISFTSGCLNDMDLITQDSSFHYTNSNGNSVTNSITLSAAKVSGVTTYTANLPSAGIILYPGQDIGFNIQTNSYCEAGFQVVEFTLDAIPGTPEPTLAPSLQPSANPTKKPTDELTKGPTSFPSKSPTTPECDDDPFECSDGTVITKYYSIVEMDCVWPDCVSDSDPVSNGYSLTAMMKNQNLMIILSLFIPLLFIVV